MGIDIASNIAYLSSMDSRRQQKHRAQTWPTNNIPAPAGAGRAGVPHRLGHLPHLTRRRKRLPSNGVATRWTRLATTQMRGRRGRRNNISL